MTSPVMIVCKPCNRRMSRLDWMKNKACDNPECKCPEVQRAMKATQVAIKRAQQSRSGEETNRQFNRITIKSTPVPNGRDAENYQLYVEVPEVLTIDISPMRKK